MTVVEVSAELAGGRGMLRGNDDNYSRLRVQRNSGQRGQPSILCRLKECRFTPAGDRARALG